jgi:hypothetical protein
MLRNLLAITTLALPVAARAQQLAAPVSVHQDLPPLGTRVRVRAAGIFGSRQTGTVIRRSGDTLTLAIKGDEHVAVPLARMSSLETSTGISRGRGAVRGAIIVGAIAASVVILDGEFGSTLCGITPATMCDNAVSRKKGVSASALTSGLAFGVGLGAFAGSFWPIESWQSVALQRVSVGVAPRGVMTAGLSFSLP